MHKLRPLILISAFLLFTSFQAIAAETPEQVCEQYLVAIKQQGMTAVPDFIHPEELQRFKDMIMPLFREGGSPNREDLIHGFFGKSATPESVEAMLPGEFMRGFMGIADAQMKKLNVTIGKTEIIGSITEGETVHLVTRATAGTDDLKLEWSGFFGHLITGTMVPEVFDGQASTIHGRIQARGSAADAGW